MPLVLGDKSEKTLAPEGPNIGRCTAVIDLGTQTSEYAGEVKEKKRLLITWELPEVTAVFNEEEGEQPLGRSKFFNASMHEKSTLRKQLTTWRGKPFTPEELKGFSLSKLLGQPCVLNIVHTEHNGQKSDRVDSVGALMKGVECPPAINEPYEYCIEDHPKNWDRLPNWVKKQIEESPEFKAATGVSAEPVDVLEEDTQDEPPF